MFPTGQQYNALRTILRLAKRAAESEPTPLLRHIAETEIRDATAYLDKIAEAVLGSAAA
jgi:hypothetical protein